MRTSYSLEVVEFSYLEKIYIEKNGKDAYGTITKIEEFSKIFPKEERRDFVLSLLIKRILEKTPQETIAINQKYESYKEIPLANWIYTSFQEDNLMATEKKRQEIKEQWKNFLEYGTKEKVGEKMEELTLVVVNDLSSTLELIYSLTQ